MRRRKFKIRGPFEGTVDDLAHDGLGIVHHEEQAIFIHGALSGEQIRFEITGKRKGVKLGRLLEVLSSAKTRATPPCVHYDICGGCSFQHLASESQIDFKHERLKRALQQASAGVPGEWLETLKGPTEHYRRKARLAVKSVPAKGRVLVGFRERGNPYVADMKQCKTLVKEVADLLEPLSELIGQLSIQQKIPQIEVALADNRLALVFRVLEPPTELDRNLIEQFSAARDFDAYLQPDGLDSVAPMRPDAEKLYYEIPSLGDKPLRLQFEPFDFVQVNADINNRMLDRAMSLLEPRKTDRVLELFSGLGNFTLPLAQRCAEVVAVEGEASLVERARANAQANGLSNIRHFTADLFDEKADKPWALANNGTQLASVDLALIDPPRTGAKEILADLGRLAPRRILYISCHPESLARDAASLIHEHGYVLSKAGVMDMFPHTAHVESIAVFDQPEVT